MAKALLLVALLVVAVSIAAEAQTASEFGPGFYKDVWLAVTCSDRTDTAIVSVTLRNSVVQTLGTCQWALRALGGILQLAPGTSFRVTSGLASDGETRLSNGLYWVEFSYYQKLPPGSHVRPRKMLLMKVPITLRTLKQMNLMPIVFSGGNLISVTLDLVAVVSENGLGKRFVVYWGDKSFGRSRWVPISF